MENNNQFGESSNPPPPPSMEEERHLHLQELERQHLQAFWAQKLQEMQELENVKKHEVPLARIKKIMRADKDVKMIARESPHLFAKACELFISDLTIRSWTAMEKNRRKSLFKTDVKEAVKNHEIFDFLINDDDA